MNPSGCPRWQTTGVGSTSTVSCPFVLALRNLGEAGCGVGQNLQELFDVVDEQDRVIGRAPRREVHARGLRHRAVHMLVVNRAGEVFLHQRSMAKDLFPGAWDSSAAGHVGAGEDYDGTALRELEEELGCRPARAPQRLFKIAARGETGQEFTWVYRVEAEGPFTLQPEEIERGSWFTVAEIDRWLAERPQELAPAFAHLWPKARSYFPTQDTG
jgi:isopentenyl-diphosphate delta-isomerase type 1